MQTFKYKLRKILRSEYLSIMGKFSKPHKGIYLLGGHMSHRETPDVKYMERLMQALDQAGFFFLKFQDAVNMIVNKVNTDRPYVAFSFDDGFSECADTICPVLEKYGINGMFFVNPGFIDGDKDYIHWFTNGAMHNPGKTPMSWDTLAELIKRGHLVGAHTIDHYNINVDDISELKHQIVDCRSIIEKRLGITCDYFAWPYGQFSDANDNALEIALQTYKYVFSLTDYRHYFSVNGKVINRRHFEPFWPVTHTLYFLGKAKEYED